MLEILIGVVRLFNDSNAAVVYFVAWNTLGRLIIMLDWVGLNRGRLRKRRRRAVHGGRRSSGTVLVVILGRNARNDTVLFAGIQAIRVLLDLDFWFWGGLKHVGELWFAATTARIGGENGFQELF